MSFAERYGPWAVISGASEGTGRSLALEIARGGVNCVLVARRQAPLDDVAAEVRALGVDCLTVSVDLSAADASAQIVDAVGAREIGLYISNAGADSQGAHFLDRAIDDWTAQIDRSITTMLRNVHHFATAMRARRCGGIVLVGSGGCYGGAANMAAYSAIKAFGLNFAESLWAELEPHGVDVIYAALGTTDTPALRRLLEIKGLPVIAGLADPDEVARTVLAALPHGPLLNWGQADDEVGRLPMSAADRRARVLAIGEATKRIFGG